jgi:ribosomal protein S18 acetylase RimI-like enzyme
MTTDVTVRRAEPGDSDTVLAMMNEIAGHEAVGSVDVSPEQWRELLQRDDVIVFLAEHRGAAVGYVSAVRKLHLWLGREIVALDDLYVRPDHRDGGVGRLLMVAMAAVAAPEARTVRWEVECDNTAAQRFYARLGARLRTKTIAAWAPDDYRQHLAIGEEDAC